MTPHTATLCAYAAGLVATLAIASVLTPARWWRRPNARAAAILAGGTWGIGALLLALFQPLAMARPEATAASDGVAALDMSTPVTPLHLQRGVQYRVYQTLNLRAGASTSAARMAVVPVGAVVTASGMRDGDWWQLRIDAGGQQRDGWASSLWLRRLDEAPSADAAQRRADRRALAAQHRRENLQRAE